MFELLTLLVPASEIPGWPAQSLDPKGFIPNFKTVDLAADQSLPANSTFASKIRKSTKNVKKNRRPTFLMGRQKLTVAPRTL